MMEMAGKSVVKKQIHFIFISNRFRTKRSLHDCGGDDGAGMAAIQNTRGCPLPRIRERGREKVAPRNL